MKLQCFHTNATSMLLTDQSSSYKMKPQIKKHKMHSTTLVFRPPFNWLVVFTMLRDACVSRTNWLLGPDVVGVRSPARAKRPHQPLWNWCDRKYDQRAVTSLSCSLLITYSCALFVVGMSWPCEQNNESRMWTDSRYWTLAIFTCLWDACVRACVCACAWLGVVVCGWVAEREAKSYANLFHLI